MDSARFFGEAVTQAFSDDSGFYPLTDLEGGYAVIQMFTPAAFSTLQIGHPNSTPVSLTGFAFPAGTILYGVRKYQVLSGTGIAYHSGIK